MSSLITDVDENAAWVATDTLGVGYDSSPLLFAAKALHLPHVNILMAGTGVSRMMDGWFYGLNGQQFAGIDELAAKSTIALRKRWAEFRGAFPVSEDATCSIFTFGFSETTGRMRVLMNSSSYDWELRDQPVPFSGQKPPGTLPTAPHFPSGLMAAMLDQRAVQAAKPPEKRLHIGGAIIMHCLTREGCTSQIVSRFADYDDTLRSMQPQRPPESN